MKTKRLILILDGVLAFLVLCSGWIARLMLQVLPDCFVTRLGMECPACGGTRCIQAMAAGKWGAAFAYNGYIFITAILAGIVLIGLNMGFVFSISWCRKGLQRIPVARLVIIWAVGFVLFGILRNLV
jgi:hypothetical protein